MACEVKIIADSIGHHNRRVTTFQLRYWRAIHAELMTHRVFSRNASSSRAIPVKKMLEQVRTDPAGPIHWGKNIAGMQANEELIGVDLEIAKQYWRDAAVDAAHHAENMMELGLHKQVANRILEPFQYISVVLTATEYDNWFALRAHKDAQPEIQELAVTMQDAYKESKPEKLQVGEWHVPYLENQEILNLLADGSTWYDVAKISAARCCRVSYLKHDGTTPSIKDDLELFNRLAGSAPPHMSPLEHCAMCGDEDKFYFNLRGWKSYRFFYETYEVQSLERR